MYFNCTSKNLLRIKSGHSEENVNIRYFALFWTETLIQFFTDQCLLYFRKRKLPFRCLEISPLTMVLLLKLALIYRYFFLSKCKKQIVDLKENSM